MVSTSCSVRQLLLPKYIYLGYQSQRTSGLVFVREICLIILRSFVLSYYALLLSIVSLSLYHGIQDAWDEFVIDAVIDTNSQLYSRSVPH